MQKDEFKRLQEAAGMSARQVADCLSITPRAVKYWRSGQRKISPAMAELIKIKIEKMK